MPCEAGMRRTPPNDLVGQKRMQIMHGVDLSGGRVRPMETKRSHPPLHLGEHEEGLLTDSVGRGFPPTHGALAVRCAALLRLSASRDDERSRRAGVGHRE